MIAMGSYFPSMWSIRWRPKAVRADLERAEAECADDPEKLSLVRSYPSNLIPSFDTLIRNPNLIAAVTPILGPDLYGLEFGIVY